MREESKNRFNVKVGDTIIHKSGNVGKVIKVTDDRVAVSFGLINHSYWLHYLDNYFIFEKSKKYRIV